MSKRKMVRSMADLAGRRKSAFERGRLSTVRRIWGTRAEWCLHMLDTVPRVLYLKRRKWMWTHTKELWIV